VHVQLTVGGPFHAAAGWLALARRSRLLPRMDLATLELALQAIAHDGQARAVHLAWLSITAPGFVADVALSLASAPQAARLLQIEWGDDIGEVDQSVCTEAATLWRPWGVQLGVQHAGALAQELAHLGALGLQYVRFEGRHVRGVASDPAVHAYAQSLVALVHGQGLRALAAGVDDSQDLQALWALGFDGASGAAVQGAGGG
nr:EAL domain-containing protein [Rubrivivax sp.]